ncbi:exonuclease II Exo2 [Polyrhizophydium stewartii]|uniref:Exonuclease II Exo2 n=1 Tax=Polyrhizophydium stewartii TaxID=2732419 RepID=A0ABR4N7D9_9FUNG
MMADGRVPLPEGDSVQRADLHPGSRFYDLLESELHAAFAIEVPDPAAGGGACLPEFGVSGSHEPGEGEIKLLRRMLDISAAQPTPRPRFMVVSADSDTVLQRKLIAPYAASDGHSRQHVFVAIPDADCMVLGGIQGPLFDLQAVRNEISRLLPDFNMARVLRDIVVLSLLTGNDMLPSVPYLSLDNLFEIYSGRLTALAQAGVDAHLVDVSDTGISFNLVAIHNVLACQPGVLDTCITPSSAEPEMQVASGTRSAIHWMFATYALAECPDYRYIPFASAKGAEDAPDDSDIIRTARRPNPDGWAAAHADRAAANDGYGVLARASAVSQDDSLDQRKRTALHGPDPALLRLGLRTWVARLAAAAGAEHGQPRGVWHAPWPELRRNAVTAEEAARLLIGSHGRPARHG